MTKFAISAEGLGKKYVIGGEAERERYVALRDVLTSGAKKAWRKTASLLRGQELVVAGAVEEFWALRGVSFEVKRGEVLGIIGRNGAGKSTLLKVLSRITEPSDGRVVIKGRVASLLEVGTGFHPELTGRENIYLNGAILGMTRAEIRRKFDEIVAFAEVERFLDTPVKRYSSGMYVRLAFAVAAHVEPEILVVDEVLAVGDAEFQKKCLGKMSEVAGGGRTILFVSHNMTAISRLCDRCLLMERGEITFDGAPASAVALYLRRVASSGNATKWSIDGSRGQKGDEFVLLSVEVRGTRSTGPIFAPDEELSISLVYSHNTRLTGARVGIQLETSNGETAFASIDQTARGAEAYLPGTYESICRIPGGLLNRTSYFIRVWAGIPGQRVLLHPVDVGQFAIDGVGNEAGSYAADHWPGAVCPRLQWLVRSRDCESAACPAEMVEQ
ncbi:ABC transporter ATP-binding protein (plasmid) [Bradyrhizobium sp. ISRA443]|uniref:ABC transporter ATP-binding protein n=1 Tax=unclassified Bradyrhizobium TaxID=2631580 RepID=UPI0024783A30|nr:MULTISPECIES: ABC transporter ATP-binding protein [unclassified Bradyrhizobium]WGR90784.1 ABC transporter ATP-binding protein [Bradyrhizobium sp. ISRA435]WGS03086.1 ABC transporter ATP-binding protein [Bradyrhizobium sp. ISRA436]WGS09880.1 ABC transporter ATP-binding protein [Bradyrhizobium sp. ISRA437]WGS16765.1 ABC transporter ATP-binding protein [Bradyrhizobium sp. ISRA443]